MSDRGETILCVVLVMLFEVTLVWLILDAPGLPQ